MKTIIDNKYDYSVYYRHWHDDSPEHAKEMADYILKEIKQFLPSADDQPVLEIGCGMGFGMLALQQYGFQNVQGVDSDAKQIEAAQKKGLNVTLVENVIEWLCDRSSQFKVILLMDVLEHIPVDSQIAVMRAVFHALRPNGSVILSVPNASAILASRHRYNDYTHHVTFTEKSLYFVLKNAGFSEIQIPGQRKLMRPSLRLWKKQNRLDWRRYLIYWVWRNIYEVYYGHFENIDAISFEINLLAKATKETNGNT